VLLPLLARPAPPPVAADSTAPALLD
jgi:hypothetical protein